MGRERCATRGREARAIVFTVRGFPKVPPFSAFDSRIIGIYNIG